MCELRAEERCGVAHPMCCSPGVQSAYVTSRTCGEGVAMLLDHGDWGSIPGPTWQAETNQTFENRLCTMS